MKTNHETLAVSMISLAVRGALAALAVIPLSAMAEGDDDVAALTNPTNTVTVGVGGVSTDSTKFGEYNGLHDSGAYFVGGLGIRGGSAYGQGDGTVRWSITGSDLGTDSRELGASFIDQGTWRIGIDFDRLRHYTTTNYQTPYQGSMGGNNFTLPSNFGVINRSQSASGASGGNTLVGARSLTDTQLSDFSTKDVYTQRENTRLNAGYDFSPHWNVRFDFNHQDQTGAKLIGSGTDAVTAGGFRGEAIAILMNPTKYQTDTVSAAVNWTGEHGYATVDYYGSFFHDDYRGMTWSNPFQSALATGTVPAGGLPTSTMSTPPSNQFHQLNFKGGYSFTDKTHFVGGLSYGRNTQDESFDGTYTSGTVSNLPGNSLNGVVIMTHADARLSNQTTKNLALSASFKFNERKNQTASRLYNYLNLGGDNLYAWSAPISNRKTQFDLAGDYRITSAQKLHVGYEYEAIKRWCVNSPSYGQIVSAMASSEGFNAAQLASAEAYYAHGTSCAQVPESRENRLVADYRLKATETLNFSAGLEHGDRKATVNSSFYNPIQSFNQGFENPGFLAYFDASRREDAVKARVNWQALARLSFGISGKYRKDDYYDATYGVGKGTVSSANLDATYSFSAKSSVSAFASWQWRSRDLNTEAGRMIAVAGSPTTPPNLWSNNLQDDDITFGLNGKQNGLFGSHLDLREDLTYSLAKTDYKTTVNYATTGCSTTVANNTSNQACGSAPTIRSELLQLKLSGNYHVDKSSSILMGYLYQHLKADDYYYNAYQYPNGFTTGLPSNQQAPNYSVNAAYVAYQYSFR